MKVDLLGERCKCGQGQYRQPNYYYQFRHKVKCDICYLEQDRYILKRGLKLIYNSIENLFT